MLGQLLQLNLGIEAALGFHHHFSQNTAVVVPFPEAFQVACPALIIQDKGHHIMPQAFLEHDQPSDSAVTIFERKDPLEAHMEVQDIPTIHFFQRLIPRSQQLQLVADTIRGQDEAFFSLRAFGTELARSDFLFALIHGAEGELVMEVLDELGGQRFFDLFLPEFC